VGQGLRPLATGLGQGVSSIATGIVAGLWPLLLIGGIAAAGYWYFEEHRP